MKRKSPVVTATEEGADDLVTLVLVKWDLKKLLLCMRLILTILEEEEGGDLEERFFAENTLIHCSEVKAISFRCFVREVFFNATALLLQQEHAKEGEEYFLETMRGIFLIALVRDTRVQRFVMSEHNIHRLVFHSRPPPPSSTNKFMDSVIEPLINSFLSLSLSLTELSLQCHQQWLSHSLKTTIEKQKEQKKEDIQYTDLQQTWWKLVQTGSGSCLSELDELGF